jgi:exopolyphosphatase/pppGpp-phosphohydrolase
MDACILELGTRSFNLHHARLTAGGTLVQRLVQSQRVTIDASLDAGGAIGKRTWAEALRALERLVVEARRISQSGSLVAFAPHALGGAENAEGFVHAVGRRFGVHAGLLSPGESARLAYRGVRHELGDTVWPVAVMHVGDASLDVAAGVGPECDFTATCSLGIGRVHRAYGPSGGGLLPADAGALSSLVRLIAGPACRRLRDWGEVRVVVGSESALAVRDVARSWGYLEADGMSLGRIALRALAQDVLDVNPESLCRIGIEPSRAGLVGTTAVVIGALADLLEQREVRFATSGFAEGAALDVLAGLEPRVSRGLHRPTAHVGL